MHDASDTCLPGVPKISYTFVRGASDFLYAPPLQVSPGNWIDNPAAPAANFDVQVRPLSAVCILDSPEHGNLWHLGSIDRLKAATRSWPRLLLSHIAIRQTCLSANPFCIHEAAPHSLHHLGIAVSCGLQDACWVLKSTCTAVHLC